MRDSDALILPAPGNVLEGADMRVQEMIHGHRFIPEQEPFMIVLEALAVCASVPLGTVVPGDAVHESFSYELPHRRKMRFLLFVDRHLEKVANNETIPDHAKWEKWKGCVNDQYDSNRSGQDHFAYLDPIFDRKIDSLLQAICLIRSRELDVMHNRRWTSRFLAVTGPHMICTDMRETANRHWSVDRRFFGRGGELVYLMLNRSRLANDIGRMVKKRFLNTNDPINRIAAALCDPAGDDKSTTHVGYLPYRNHPTFEHLAEDWHGILTLDRLPDGHLFEPLFRITGLNLVCYLAECSRNQIGAVKAEPIILDLTDGDDKQLRQFSKEHLNRHRQASNRAVQAYVEFRTNKDDGWGIAVSHEDPIAAKEVIKRLFSYENSEARPSEPKRQLEALIEQAKSRDKNNTHKYFLPLVKGIGLATSRQRVGAWFGVDDAMIFSLVVANVSRSVELREFVTRLYDRYGLVIGPREARRAFNRLPVGVHSFEANLAALESRMTRLDLTRRLSDDCAFVTNPYRHNND